MIKNIFVKSQTTKAFVVDVKKNGRIEESTVDGQKFKHWLPAKMLSRTVQTRSDCF